LHLKRYSVVITPPQIIEAHKLFHENKVYFISQICFNFSEVIAVNCMKISAYFKVVIFQTYLDHPIRAGTTLYPNWDVYVGDDPFKIGHSVGKSIRGSSRRTKTVERDKICPNIDKIHVIILVNGLAVPEVKVVYQKNVHQKFWSN